MAFKICQEVPIAFLDNTQLASLSLAQGRLADRSCSLLPCLRNHGTSIEIRFVVVVVVLYVCVSVLRSTSLCFRGSITILQYLFSYTYVSHDLCLLELVDTKVFKSCFPIPVFPTIYVYSGWSIPV